MKVSIVNKNIPKTEEVCALICKYVDEYGFTYNEENPDIVFFVGGDGTLLSAIHRYYKNLDKIIFIGINVATLGFFYDYEIKDIPYIFEKIANNSLNIKSFPLLKGNCNELEVFALNEIRIENPWHTLICNVFINDEFVETFHGNGLLVCSCLGSSAYNKSINGAIIDHSLDLLELTEIATIQNNIHRSIGNSIILPKENKITFVGDFNQTVLGYDHLTKTINGENKIDIYLSDIKVKLVTKENISFISRINRSFVQ